MKKQKKKTIQENIVNEQIHDNDINSVKIECSESSEKYTDRNSSYMKVINMDYYKYVECI